jgi:hypothetical protein
MRYLAPVEVDKEDYTSGFNAALEKIKALL